MQMIKKKQMVKGEIYIQYREKQVNKVNFITTMLVCDVKFLFICTWEKNSCMF